MDTNQQFPTLVQFEELTERSSSTAAEKITPFRELPTNVVFKIINVKHIKVKERNAVILELQDQAEVSIKVWATSVLVKNLEEKRAERENKVLYIVSKGKKISSNNRVYHDFAVIMRCN